MFPHLSKLLLLFNISQRHAKLDSDLLAASMPLYTYQLHIHVRLQPPFVAEIKIVTISGSLSSNTATVYVWETSTLQYLALIKGLECLYELSFPLPLLVISNSTFHFLRQGHVYLRNLCYRMYRTCTPSLHCGNQRGNDFLVISNTVVQ